VVLCDTYHHLGKDKYLRQKKMNPNLVEERTTNQKNNAKHEGHEVFA